MFGGERKEVGVKEECSADLKRNVPSFNENEFAMCMYMCEADFFEATVMKRTL